jgi:hypothetical protein
VPTGLIASQGSANVTVLNPNGASSNPLTLTINPSTASGPTLFSVSPNSTVAGGSGVAPTVVGSGFQNGAVVQVEMGPLVHVADRSASGQPKSGSHSAPLTHSLWSSSPTRTLAPLRRKGWLQAEAGADLRPLRLALTAEGKREYRRVLTWWQTAQKGLQQALGKKTWTELVDAAVLTAGVMQERD